MSLVIKFFFHFFYAQQVSDINTSIIRSLRILYCITTLVVFLFRCVLEFGVAVLGWYPCSRLKHTSNQEHTTNVVIQQKISRLLMMDVLMFETC